MKLDKFAYLYSKLLENHTLKIMKKIPGNLLKDLEKSWKYHGILSVLKSGNPVVRSKVTRCYEMKTVFTSVTISKIELIQLTAIHSKNLVAILHLLIALARYFRAPIRMPDNVVVAVVVVQVRPFSNVEL